MSGTFGWLHYNPETILRAEQVRSLKESYEKRSTATGFIRDPMRLKYLTEVVGLYGSPWLIRTARWGLTDSHISAETSKGFVQLLISRSVSSFVIRRVLVKRQIPYMTGDYFCCLQNMLVETVIGAIICMEAMQFPIDMDTPISFWRWRAIQIGCS